MKKMFMWVGIVLGSLVGLVIFAGVGFYQKGNASLQKTYEFPPSNLTIPTDAASMERGKHFVDTLCLTMIKCPGRNLGESVFLAVS